MGGQGGIRDHLALIGAHWGPMTCIYKTGPIYANEAPTYMSLEIIRLYLKVEGRITRNDTLTNESLVK